MNEELKATEALLDIGISVPLRPLRFRKRQITPRVTIKRPPLGGLLRILRVWLAFGVTADELEKMDENGRLQFLSKYGRNLGKMVALMVCSGFFSGKLFAPALGAFLRWRCHPEAMVLAAASFMQLLDTKSFTIIIRSGNAINVAAPNLSHQKKRS